MSVATLFSSRVVPVIVVDDARHAIPIAEALLAGGIDCAEVTMRTPAALESIRLMATETPIVVGAGTVKRVEHAEAALEAGARFAVSPGVSRTVAEYCAGVGLPLLPGTVTASEVMQALDLGIELLKFFPAGTAGGVKAVAAFAGPFPEASFIPTGGVSAANLGEYLALPNVAAVGGTWLTPQAAQEARSFHVIEQLARDAVAASEV